MGVGVASGGKRGRSVVGPQPTTILPIFVRASKARANQLNVTHGTKDTPRTKRTENESNHSCMCMQKKNGPIMKLHGDAMQKFCGRSQGDANKQSQS